MEAEKQRSSTDAEPMEAQKQRSSTDAMSSDKALEQIKAAGAKSQEQLVKASSPLGHKPAVKKEQTSKSLRNGWKETKDADGNVYYWNYWTRETTYSKKSELGSTTRPTTRTMTRTRRRRTRR